MKNNVLTRIDRVAKAITKTKLNDLERSIGDMVDKAVTSILGLEKDNWGRVGYTIDHCNGRQSYLITKSQEFGSKALEKILAKMTFTKVEEGHLMDAIKKEAERGLLDRIRIKYNDMMDQTIHKFLIAMFKEHEQKIEKEIKRSIGLIENVVEEQKKTGV